MTTTAKQGTQFIEWGLGIDYQVGDNVFVENDAGEVELFKAKQAHPSTAQNKPLEGVNWLNVWNPVENPRNSSSSSSSVENSNSNPELNTNTTTTTNLASMGGSITLPAFFGGGESGSLNTSGLIGTLVNIGIIIIFLFVLGLVVYYVLGLGKENNILKSFREKQKTGNVPQSGVVAMVNSIQNLVRYTEPGMKEAVNASGPTFKRKIIGSQNLVANNVIEELSNQFLNIANSNSQKGKVDIINLTEKIENLKNGARRTIDNMYNPSRVDDFIQQERYRNSSRTSRFGGGFGGGGYGGGF